MSASLVGSEMCIRDSQRRVQGLGVLRSGRSIDRRRKLGSAPSSRALAVLEVFRGSVSPAAGASS
eukprot:8982150-Alexandrium_andersonii.AAC.1